MASLDSPVSLTGTGLISVGAAATTVGGLGVGFRAAGLGYLGQSLLALVIGVALLTAGVRIAAASRRSLMAQMRLTPVRLAASGPYQPIPQRVRVHAWTTPHLELPPGRAA